MVSENRLEDISSKLKDFASKQKIIKARIKGFGGIDNWKGTVEGKVTPYVIWLEVEVSNDLLKLHNDLKDEIVSKEETWLPRTTNYVPHVTIAFSDLDKDGYENGIKYLAEKSLDMEFVISHFALVECYGEGNMTSVEYMKYYFN